MNVLIPLRESEQAPEIHRDFDSTGSYLLCRTDTGEVLPFDPDALTGQKGGGSIFDVLEAQKITHIITPSIRAAAFVMLKRWGITICKPQGLEVAPNLEAFKKGLLNEMTLDDLGPWESCLSGCSSCDSDCKS